MYFNHELTYKEYEPFKLPREPKKEEFSRFYFYFQGQVKEEGFWGELPEICERLSPETWGILEDKDIDPDDAFTILKDSKYIYEAVLDKERYSVAMKDFIDTQERTLDSFYLFLCSRFDITVNFLSRIAYDLAKNSTDCGRYDALKKIVDSFEIKLGNVRPLEYQDHGLINGLFLLMSKGEKLDPSVVVALQTTHGSGRIVFGDNVDFDYYLQEERSLLLSWGWEEDHVNKKWGFVF